MLNGPKNTTLEEVESLIREAEVTLQVAQKNATTAQNHLNEAKKVVGEITDTLRELRGLQDQLLQVSTDSQIISRIKHDATRMDAAPSTLLQAVSHVLQRIIDDENASGLLAKVVLESIHRIHSKTSTPAIRVSAAANPKISVRIYPTNDSIYYLIYDPSSLDTEFLYVGYTPANPKRFTPDTRFLVLEVDMNKAGIPVYPVVLLNDDEQPMTHGPMAMDYVTPPGELTRRLVNETIVLLQSGQIAVGDHMVSRGTHRPSQLHDL